MDEEKLRELVERAKNRDVEAFGSLYDFYVSGIYRYTYYRVGSKEDAEDLTEEVFLKALEAIGRFTWREVPFSAWLYRIARNTVVDHFRRKTRRVQVVLEEGVMAPETTEPVALVAAKLSQEEVQRAISRLTDDQQQVVILKFFVGLSNSEVANFIGKTEGAVKALQHRALESLSKILRGSQGDE